MLSYALLVARYSKAAQISCGFLHAVGPTDVPALSMHTYRHRQRHTHIDSHTHSF